MLLYYWPGPPLSIRQLHTILVGGHFPQKINNDFCLAFYINPSSMNLSDNAGKEFSASKKTADFLTVLQSMVIGQSSSCNPFATK